MSQLVEYQNGEVPMDYGEGPTDHGEADGEMATKGEYVATTKTASGEGWSHQVS